MDIEVQVAVKDNWYRGVQVMNTDNGYTKVQVKNKDNGYIPVQVTVKDNTYTEVQETNKDRQKHKVCIQIIDAELSGAETRHRHTTISHKRIKGKHLC